MPVIIDNVFFAILFTIFKELLILTADDNDLATIY